MGLRVGVDAEEAAQVLESFLREAYEASGASGAVLGVSGGLDSAVVAHLAVRALGRETVRALVLPERDGPNRDVAHALLVCEQLGVAHDTLAVGPIVDALVAQAGPLERAARGNATARARMLVLYAEANRRGALVLGTGNKSELLTGYFTKHGDGGVDVQPLGDLYKTQVRILAEHYGVPEVIRHKAPTAGLWEGQTDEADLGMPYETLDRVLLGLEIQLPFATIAERAGVPLPEVERLDALRRATQHKRRGPLVPRLGIRTVGLDWRAALAEGPRGGEA